MKEDQERVRALLTDTVTLLCTNGLNFCRNLSVQGLIGITLDDDEVFIVHINENKSRQLCNENTDLPLTGNSEEKPRSRRRNSSHSELPAESSPKTSITERPEMTSSFVPEDLEEAASSVSAPETDVEKSQMAAFDIKSEPGMVLGDSAERPKAFWQRPVRRPFMRYFERRPKAGFSNIKNSGTLPHNQKCSDGSNFTIDLETPVESAAPDNYSLMSVSQSTGLENFGETLYENFEVQQNTVSDVQWNNSPEFNRGKSLNSHHGLENREQQPNWDSSTFLQNAVKMEIPELPADHFNQPNAHETKQVDLINSAAAFHRPLFSMSGTWPYASGRRPVNSLEKKFVCNYPGCGLNYYERKNLLQHQSLKHGRTRSRSSRGNFLLPPF